MDWKVIALIVSLCLNAVLLIRQFAGLLSDLKRLMARLAGWLLRRPMAFNQWRWWKKYRPSWEIISHGDLQIKYDGIDFHMELQIDMIYKNRNDRHDAQYEGIGSHIWVEVYHQGKGWEKQPYQLWEKVPIHQRTLKPSDFEEIIRVFEGSVTARPLIGNAVICKIKSEVYGGINTPHVSLGGKLKRKGVSKFKANVVCEFV